MEYRPRLCGTTIRFDRVHLPEHTSVKMSFNELVLLHGFLHVSEMPIRMGGRSFPVHLSTTCLRNVSDHFEVSPYSGEYTLFALY